MSESRCNECKRNFSSPEALDQHNKDKHVIGGSVPKHETERKKAARSKIVRQSAYIAIPVLLIAAAFAFIFLQPPATGNAVYTGDIPKTPIHWHPKLEIIINGQEYPIPMNLGLSGPAHSPVHTHTEGDGTLHYELNSPTPENMPLHYFFDKVWRKRFNSTCIFDYCNGDSGMVKMHVNGKENYAFENYIPRDKDIIRIEYN